MDGGDVEQQIADPYHPDDEGAGNGPPRGERRERGHNVEKIDADLSFPERCDAASKRPKRIQRNSQGKPRKRNGPCEAQEKSPGARQSATPTNGSGLRPFELGRGSRR